MYKFSSAGGVADTDTQVNATPINDHPFGLTFGKDRHLYATLEGAGEVVELDPYTGAIIRIIATNLHCPIGITTDPLSGDLFVSDICTSKIVRISNFATGPGAVTTYASIDVDGITFAPDGTLYAAAYDGDVVKISGTNTDTPGTVTPIVSVPSLDGIAVAANGDPSTPPFLFVNRNDGVITRVDLTTSPPTLTDIFTGGTRGDFVAVGPDGCLYATQSTSIVKLTNSDGTCSLAPTSVVPSWVAPTPRDKTPFDVRVGSSQTFTVKAQANGQGGITITHSQLPGGVTCTDTANPGNPAQVDCTISPSTSGFSTVMFDAQFVNGASAGQRTYTIGAGRYVALGDSYSSGEGNSPFIDKTDSSASLPGINSGDPPLTVPDDQCHRSSAAYPEQLEATQDPHVPSQLDFWACSGAVVQDFFQPNHTITATSQDDLREIPQLDHLDDNTRLVTLSIGGNNIGFADIIKACYIDAVVNGYFGLSHDFVAHCAGEQDKIVQPKIGALEALPSTSSLDILFSSIRAKARNARILVLGYPRLFPLNLDSASSCQVYGLPAPFILGYDDQFWMNSIVAELDNVIRRAAEAHGLEYVEASYSAFNGHELCTSKPMVNPLIAPLTPEDVYSFHPNADGHQQFAKILQDEIDAPPPGTVDTISPNQTIATQVSVAPGQAQFTASSEWPGSDVMMSLVSPSGRVINRDTQDADVAHQLGSTYEVYTIANPEPGPWTVQLFGADVGQDGEDVRVQTAQTTRLNQPPTATFTTSSTSGHTPLQLQFDATASTDPDGTIASYSWDFGDGTTDSGPTVTHTYNQPGVYMTLLKVTDNNGAIGYASSMPLTVTVPVTTPVPPTPTPSGTSIPPTATPTGTSVPPTATPINAPVSPAATSTNAPVSPVATPTNTAPPPAATPTTVPIALAVTPSATRAGCSRAPVPLTIRLAQRSVTSGSRLTLRANTAPRAQVSAMLQVVTTKVTVIGMGRHRKQVRRTVVLYRATAQGTADRRGQLMLNPRLAYKPAKPMQASLVVTARGTCSIATRTIQVTVRPQRLYALTLDIGPHRVVSGRTLTIHARTVRDARVTATLQVTITRTVVMGVGHRRKRVRQTIVLYRATSHGAADAHGQYTGHLRITYKPVRPASATLTVIARTPDGSVTRSIRVSIS